MGMDFSKYVKILQNHKTAKKSSLTPKEWKSKYSKEEYVEAKRRCDKV